MWRAHNQLEIVRRTRFTCYPIFNFLAIVYRQLKLVLEEGLTNSDFVVLVFLAVLATRCFNTRRSFASASLRAPWFWSYPISVARKTAILTSSIAYLIPVPVVALRYRALISACPAVTCHHGVPVWREPHFHYSTEFSKLSVPVFLEGYWQSEFYFSNMRSQLIAEFALRTPLLPLCNPT